MQYVVHMTQMGEGCDYTIACAQKTETFTADNDEAAMAHVQELIRDNYSHWETRLEKVALYRVAQELEFDLHTLYCEVDDEEAEAEAKAELRRAEAALAAAQARMKKA